jgi:hypothetical protein
LGEIFNLKNEMMGKIQLTILIQIIL